MAELCAGLEKVCGFPGTCEPQGVLDLCAGQFADNYFADNEFALATALPLLAVGVRRMHDINRSGWWFGGVYLAGIVSRLLNSILMEYASPETYVWMKITLGIVLGWIPLLVMVFLCCQKSQPAPATQTRIVE